MLLLAALLNSSALAGNVRGGISGGGGDTIILDPAGTEFIKLQLSGARVSLLMVFKNAAFLSARKELFQGTNNILEKVKNYSLDIKTDDSCYDFDGTPTDASINSKPGTICLSAFTIGQKVSMVTDYPQLLALLAHEYSHLMGYDEDQAVSFQKDILFATKAVSESEGRYLGVEFVTESFTAITYLTGAAAEISRNQDQEAYKMFQTVDSLNFFPYQYPFRALDPKEAGIVGGIAARLKNLRIYSCIQNESDLKQKQTCQSIYQSVFGNSDEVPADQLNHFYYGNTDVHADGNIPNIVKNPSKYLEETHALQDELQKMADSINVQLQMRD